MSILEYYVLMAVSGRPLHGYAIKDVVVADSGGSQAPPAGTLYRVIARLITAGLLRETSGTDTESHPGLARRYYGLTPRGRRTLLSESRQLKTAAAAAEKRLGEIR